MAGPDPLSPDDLLARFEEVADAVVAAVEPLVGSERRARTDVAGQYALDLVADAAVLAILRPVPVAVVSEESGRSGPPDAAITVVVDPVDGSTNCSRHIPYWGTSLCAVDADGPLAALVANLATGVRYTAVRGRGAFCAGERIAPSTAHRAEDAIACFAGLPPVALPWRQVRALGSAALSLCDVAAGHVDAFIDASGQHAPWDYLGGLLIGREAGAMLVDADGRDLVTTDPAARRQVIAAATQPLTKVALRAVGR